MKFKLIESIDDRLLEYVIEPDSDLEQAILDDIQQSDLSYDAIAKKYNLRSTQPIKSLVKRKNLNRAHKKFHLYFNTFNHVELRAIREGLINCTINFSPSIYIGKYSITEAKNILKYVKDKYLQGDCTNTALLKFYLDIFAKNIKLTDLIKELEQITIRNYSGSVHNSKYEFITISETELDTIDFYSYDYRTLSSEILYLWSRSKNDTRNSEAIISLKSIASKISSDVADYLHNSDNSNMDSIEYIAANIFSKHGDVVKTSNYIAGIAYEEIFDIESLDDIVGIMQHHAGYMLYGFVDISGDVVYIGITTSAQGRAQRYANEDRELINRAFTEKLIRKFVIFKTNLPGQTRLRKTDLLYDLEVFLAEKIFKTYPAHYPKALNKDKPGKNSSSYLASYNKLKFETYISNYEKLLSSKEFFDIGNKVLGADSRQIYSYIDYASMYIDKNEGKISLADKKVLYNNSDTHSIHLLWKVCSSESEYKELIKDLGLLNPYKPMSKWRKYRKENNLPITEDLDDNINGGLYR